MAPEGLDDLGIRPAGAMAICLQQMEMYLTF